MASGNGVQARGAKGTAGLAERARAADLLTTERSLLSTEQNLVNATYSLAAKRSPALEADLAA